MTCCQLKCINHGHLDFFYFRSHRTLKRWNFVFSLNERCRNRPAVLTNFIPNKLHTEPTLKIVNKSYCKWLLNIVLKLLLRYWHNTARTTYKYIWFNHYYVIFDCLLVQTTLIICYNYVNNLLKPINMWHCAIWRV
jgi:hypothetical protein